MEKWLIPGTEWKMYKINPRQLTVSESKGIIKDYFDHVEVQ